MKGLSLICLCTAAGLAYSPAVLSAAPDIRDTVKVQNSERLSAAESAADISRNVDSTAVLLNDTSGTWTLRRCIEYALVENISLQKSRIAVDDANVDIKTAKGALFPSLSFSTSHSVINRPYQESSATVSGTEILESNSNTSYTGNYGLNAQWTVYNGGRNRKTIRQEELNTRIAELDVSSTANDIMESIAQTYIQILYANESVDVNRNTLEVSTAQLERGKELLASGSISRADYAQLESQVSNDKYQLVTAQTTLQDYRLQLKQVRPFHVEGPGVPARGRHKLHVEAEAFAELVQAAEHGIAGLGRAGAGTGGGRILLPRLAGGRGNGLHAVVFKPLTHQRGDIPGKLLLRCGRVHGKGQYQHAGFGRLRRSRPCKQAHGKACQTRKNVAHKALPISVQGCGPYFPQVPGYASL